MGFGAHDVTDTIWELNSKGLRCFACLQCSERTPARGEEHETKLDAPRGGGLRALRTPSRAYPDPVVRCGRRQQVGTALRKAHTTDLRLDVRPRLLPLQPYQTMPTNVKKTLDICFETY